MVESAALAELFVSGSSSSWSYYPLFFDKELNMVKRCVINSGAYPTISLEKCLTID